MKKLVPFLVVSATFLSGCSGVAAPTNWDYLDIDFDLSPCTSVDITYQDKKVVETYSVTEWDDICYFYDSLVILEYNPSGVIKEEKVNYDKEYLYFDFIGCDFSLTVVPDYYILSDGTILTYKSCSFYFDNLIEKVKVIGADYLLTLEER